MFLTVVENSHIAPHHYLEFPVLTKGWSPAEWSEMMSEELETSGPTIGPMMKTMSNMLMLGGGNIAGNQAVPQQEVWDMCAMKMSLKESLTWPPFQKGFSVVMWVCLTEGQSNRFCPNMPLYNLETGRFLLCLLVHCTCNFSGLCFLTFLLYQRTMCHKWFQINFLKC